jgi:hypothetical protein
MPVIEAQCASILVPHDHRHINHERASERDLSEQVMAVRDSAAWLAAEGGDEPARTRLRLRL